MVITTYNFSAELLYCGYQAGQISISGHGAHCAMPRGTYHRHLLIGDVRLRLARHKLINSMTLDLDI
jgi:hypothetical protein